MDLEARIQKLREDFHSGTHVKEFSVLNERVRAILTDVETGEETEVYGDSLEEVLRKLIPLFERKIRRKKSLKPGEKKELKEKVRELKEMLGEIGRKKEERLESGPGEALEPRPMIEELAPEGEEEDVIGGGEEEAVEGEELGAPSIKFTGSMESEGPFDWFKKKAKGGLGSITGRVPKHKVELSERVRLELRVVAVYLKEYTMVTLQDPRDTERSNALEREISIIFGQSMDEVVTTGRSPLLVGKYKEVKEGLDMWVSKMESYLLAMKSGSSTKDFRQEWVGTSKRLGDSMQELNSVHWDNSIIAKVFEGMINAVEDIAKARRSKNWSREIQSFDRLVDEVSKFADILTTGDMRKGKREKRDVVGMSKEKVMLFRTSRRLWFDHIAYTYLYMRASLKKTGREEAEIKALANRLFKNQTSIGDMIAKGYKPLEGSQVTGLLKDHIKIAAEIVQSAYTNIVVDGKEVWAWDAKEAKPLIKKWQENADDIARKLNDLNSSCWPLGKLKMLLYEHLNANKEVLAAILRDGKTSEELQMFSSATLQVMKVAKIFYKGVAKKKCTPREIAKVVKSGESAEMTSTRDAKNISSGSCGIGPRMVKYRLDERTLYRSLGNLSERRALGTYLDGWLTFTHRHVIKWGMMHLNGSASDIEAKKQENWEILKKRLPDILTTMFTEELLVYSTEECTRIIIMYYRNVMKYMEDRVNRRIGDRSFADDAQEASKFNGVVAGYFRYGSVVMEVSDTYRKMLAEGIERVGDALANKVSDWARDIESTYLDNMDILVDNMFWVIVDNIVNGHLDELRELGKMKMRKRPPVRMVQRSGESIMRNNELSGAIEMRYADKNMFYTGYDCKPLPKPYKVELQEIGYFEFGEYDSMILMEYFLFWLADLRRLITYVLSYKEIVDREKKIRKVKKEMEESADSFARLSSSTTTPEGKYVERLGNEYNEVTDTLNRVVKFVEDNALTFKKWGTRQGKFVEDDELMEKFMKVATGWCTKEVIIMKTFNRMFTRYRTYLYAMADTYHHKEDLAQGIITRAYKDVMFKDQTAFINAMVNCLRSDDERFGYEVMSSTTKKAPRLEEYSKAEYSNTFNMNEKSSMVPSKRHQRGEHYSPHPRTATGTPLTFFEWSNRRGFWGKWTELVIGMVDAVIVNAGVITDERDDLIDYGSESVRKLNYMRFLTISEERANEIIRAYAKFVEDLANKGANTPEVKKFSNLDDIESRLLVVFGGWCMERNNEERKKIVSAFVNHASKLREYVRESASALVRLPFSFELEDASVNLVIAARKLSNAFTNYIKVHGRTPGKREEKKFDEEMVGGLWGVSEEKLLSSQKRSDGVGSHGVVLASKCHKSGMYHRHHHHMDKKVGAHFWKKFSKTLVKYLITYSGTYNREFSGLSAILLKRTGLRQTEELKRKLVAKLSEMEREAEKWKFMSSEKIQKFKEDLLKATDVTLEVIPSGDTEKLRNEVLFTWIGAFDVVQEACESVYITRVEGIATSVSMYCGSLISMVEFIMKNKGLNAEMEEKRVKELLRSEYSDKLENVKKNAKILGKVFKKCVKNARAMKIQYNKETTGIEKSGSSSNDALRRILGIDVIDEREEGEDFGGILKKKEERITSFMYESIDDAFGRTFWENYLNSMKLYFAKVADGNLTVSAPVSGTLFPTDADKFLDDVEREMTIPLEDSVRYAVKNSYLSESDGRKIQKGFAAFSSGISLRIEEEIKRNFPSDFRNKDELLDAWNDAISKVILMCSRPTESLADTATQLYYIIVSFAESLPGLRRKVVNEGVDVDAMEGALAKYNTEVYSESIDRHGYRFGLSFEACTKKMIQTSMIGESESTTSMREKRGESKSETMVPSETKMDEKNHDSITFSFIRRPKRSLEYRKEKIDLF